jgi:hypothetical protein
MLFEDTPNVGEFYHQSLQGQTVCGKKRNPDQFKDLSFAQAYALCSGKNGATLAMGLTYASRWRELRKTNNAKQVDEVFLKLLPQLTGEDTFQTALTKAAAITTDPALAEKVRRSFW